MEILTNTLPAFEGVAAGQIATLKVPPTFRYHEILLNYSGVTLAQMTEIRILLNSKTVQRFSATERDKLNVGEGRSASANGLLVIPFNRYGMKNRDAEEETAINCGSPDKSGKMIDSFHIEIDIDQAAAAPALSAKAKRSLSLAGGPGRIPYIFKMTRNIDVGEFDIQDLPFNRIETQQLESLFLTTTDNLTRIRLQRDTYTAFDRTIAENDLALTDGVRVPQAGYELIDFTEQGYGASLFELRGVRDFNIKLNVVAAENLPIIAKYIGDLGA